jgi:hypothetical protein
MTTASAPEREERGQRFALFAECLLAGVLIAVTALPVVTALPAFAAACAHIRAHQAGESTTLRAYRRAFAAACRHSLGVSAALLAAGVLLIVDLWAVRAGLPGGRAVAATCALAAVGLAVVALRAAATWHPGARWPALFGAAARRAVADPSGSLLLVVALGTTLVVTWQLVVLLVPMLGCLAMAAVAVEHRAAPHRHHTWGGDPS